MNRWSRLALITGLALSTTILGACADKSPPPTVADLTLTASTGINADTDGTAKPLRVRVLRLSKTDALVRSDFFALDGSSLQQTFGTDLLGHDQMVVAPGEQVRLSIDMEPEARYLAVVGAYRDINATRWRAWIPIPREKVTPVRAALMPDGITMKGSGS
ncbi:type VI secretion system protein VasD [Skermanella aerolata]|uniref:type VI secretion system lipoprotein TssJ n=1 Tax=Skermanella aerolata TaxID=393310 RepID=UPI003D23BC2A